MNDLATSTDSIVLSNGYYRWITLKSNNNVINFTLDLYNGGFLTVAEGARCLQIPENTTTNLTYTEYNREWTVRLFANEWMG